MNTKFPCIFYTFPKQSEVGQNVCIQVKNINTRVEREIKISTWSDVNQCPVLFMINWEKFFVYSAVSFRPYPPDVSMLWNFWRDPTPLGSPCPTKSKTWTMWWTNCHGIDILWHCIRKHRSTSKVHFTLHILELPGDLCHVISLLHDDRSATISMDWLLFDQWNTSAAYQLTSDLNKQQTSILLSSRKSDFNEIYM